MEFDVKIIGS